MVIKNAKIVKSDGLVEGDVLIFDGKIQKIGSMLEDEEILDAKGTYLLPGLIDLDVRLYDDKISAANLLRLGKKALKGGVTTAMLMPDTSPAIDDEISLDFVRSQSLPIDLRPTIQAIKEGGLSEISILLKKGAAGVYTSSDINPFLLARIFEYAKMHEIPLHIAPRNRIFQDVGVMNDSQTAFELGLGGIDTLEEKAEVAKVIEYSEHYKVPVLFKGVSTTKSLDLITRSSLCRAEVGIHHLLLNDRACLGYNTLAKIMPPLRDEEERKKMLQALKEGKIDIISSLHSPKSKLFKDVSFNDAKFGIDSIEVLLPLAYTFLVKNEIMDMPRLCSLLCENPGKYVDDHVGKIEEGYRANLILFDPKIQELSHPLYGPLDGKVVGVFINGEQIG